MRLYIRRFDLPADWELVGSALDRPVAEDMARAWFESHGIIEVRVDETILHWIKND